MYLLVLDGVQGETLWGGESRARNNTHKRKRKAERPNRCVALQLSHPRPRGTRRRERTCVVRAHQAGAKTIKVWRCCRTNRPGQIVSQSVSHCCRLLYDLIHSSKVHDPVQITTVAGEGRKKKAGAAAIAHPQGGAARKYKIPEAQVQSDSQ